MTQVKMSYKNKKTAIISMSDSNYYELLSELIDSIRSFEEGKNIPICILDSGMTDIQKDHLVKKVYIILFKLSKKSKKSIIPLPKLA